MNAASGSGDWPVPSVGRRGHPPIVAETCFTARLCSQFQERLTHVPGAVLAGSGTLTMGGSGNNIFAFYQPSPGNTLTNRSTIQGGGTLNPSSGNTFINENIVNANKSTPLIINGNFTNAKNGTVIGTFSATDPEGDALTYSLADNAGGKFALSGTSLVVAGGLHGSANNVTLRVTDSFGNFIGQDGNFVELTGKGHMEGEKIRAGHVPMVIP